MSRVTVGSEFVAVETSHYTHRADFMNMLRVALDAVATSRPPARVERVGIRYTNLFDIGVVQLLEPSLVGVWGKVEGAALRQTLVQAVLSQNENVSVALSSGFVRSGEAVDQGVPVRQSDAWLVDIDSYSTARAHFQVPLLLEVAEMLAVNAFKVFDWAAEKFINRARSGE